MGITSSLRKNESEPTAKISKISGRQKVVRERK